MKKLIISILMLVFVSSFVSAYADVTFNFDRNNVNALVYDCLDESCSRVTDFSGAYDESTNNGELRVLFPSSLQHRGYALYFYSEGYIPKAYKSTFNTQGNADARVSDIIIPDFNKFQNCQAVVDEFTVLNTVYENEPLQISLRSSLDATTSSAFKSIKDHAVQHVPDELKEEYYSSDVVVELTVRDSSNKVVKLETVPLTLFMDEQKTVNFEWTPGVRGDYSASIKSSVIDSQCVSKRDAYSSKDFTVLPSRPTDEYYTLINDFDVNTMHPIKDQPLALSFSKISNYADEDSNLFPVETKVVYTIYKNNAIISGEEKTLPANPGVVNPVNYGFSWTPVETGDYVVVIDAYAVESFGNKNNIEERIVLGFYVAESQQEIPEPVESDEESDERDELGIRAIRFPLGDRVRAGRNAAVSVVMKSNVDLDDSTITISIPELSIFNRKRLDIESGELISETVYLDIPDHAEADSYLVRIVVGNEDLRRIKHRQLEVTN